MLIVPQVPLSCDRDGLVDLTQPFMCHLLVIRLRLIRQKMFEWVENHVPASFY